MPVFLDERGRQHEELHQASILGQVGDETHAAPVRLINHPVHQKAAENYLDAAYKGSSDNVKIEETAAFIWSGDAAVLGITQDEAENYLAAWIGSYIETNGADKLKLFEERSNENVKAILERVIGKQTEQPLAEDDYLSKNEVAELSPFTENERSSSDAEGREQQRGG